MIKLPAPDAPPMIATIKLGTMAKDRVRQFLIHGLIRKSRKPYKYNIKVYYCQSTHYYNSKKLSTLLKHATVDQANYLHNILSGICSSNSGALARCQQSNSKKLGAPIS